MCAAGVTRKLSEHLKLLAQELLTYGITLLLSQYYFKCYAFTGNFTWSRLQQNYNLKKEY